MGYIRKLFIELSFVVFLFVGSVFAGDSKFLDDTFWSGNPDYDQIIDTLYGINSIYTSTWIGYTSSICSGMSVQYVTTLPMSLSGNTIYVLSGVDSLIINNSITFAKCSAVVGKNKVTITTSSNPKPIFKMWEENVILDNISILGDNQYIVGINAQGNNKTINNFGMYGSNGDGQLYGEELSYSYLNNIEISHNGKDLSKWCDKDDGLYLYDGCKYNKIENIKVNGSCYGLLFYDDVSYNVVNNVELYNNYYYGLGLYTNCNYNVLSNVISYNNEQDGIGFYDSSNYNSLNNFQIFNNGNSHFDGILLNGSNYNIFNNGLVYNNFVGIGLYESNPGKNNLFVNLSVFNNQSFGNNISYNGNYYYGVLNSFANGGNNEFTVLERGDSGSGVLPDGQLITGEILSWDIITNPMDIDGNYMFNWSGDLSGEYGFNENFNKEVINYSYGKLINTQSELYIWSGDSIITTGIDNNKYIGSTIEKIEGEILTNGENVVGITDNTNIGGRTYLNVPTNDVDIDVYQKVDDDMGNNKPKIGQFIMKTGKRIHTTIHQDNESPECIITYLPTKENRVDGNSVVATLTGCNEAILDTKTEYIFTENGEYLFQFQDLVGNTGKALAKVDRIVQKNSGGGGSSLKKDNCPNGDNSDSYYDGTCGEKDSSGAQNDSGEVSLIKGDGDSDLSGESEGFSQEQIDAYTRAYKNGITTMNTIETADLDGNLTRIAMAKMLSQYAVNVLGKMPDETRINQFNDVDDNLDKQYGNGVTLAYQLGIMGINMPNNEFRPFDLVTRAEFVTALSRMRYGTPDGEYAGTAEFFKNHMDMLKKEGIISLLDPYMNEIRGYVMLMLMRSAK